MPARKASASHKHDVKATLDVHGLSKTGSSLILKIQGDGEKLGELHIGRGGVFWWGRKRKTRKALSWTKFAAVLDDLAYGES